MQVAVKGEEKRKAMDNTANTIIFWTKWAEKNNTDNVWRKARTNQPEILQLVNVKYSEYRRMNWLSYKDINSWTDRVKDILIDMNIFKEELGYIRMT